MGYSDLGCYGGEIRTPNIDALATGGLRFTQFYNGGRCCPTRASLMTGLYPHQAGVGRMTNDANLPGYRGRLTENTVTIAEVLARGGVSDGDGREVASVEHERGAGPSAASEQSGDPRPFSDPATYPVARGFEDALRADLGRGELLRSVQPGADAEPVREVPKDYYITDAISDRAVRVHREFTGRGRSRFSCTSRTLPRIGRCTRWRRTSSVTRKRTVRGGMRYVPRGTMRMARARDFASRRGRALRRGIEPGVKWEDNPTRDWDARAMAVHAAMVDRMDQGVGRIVAKLREMKQLDNTLILFLSDNGASPELLERARLRPAVADAGRSEDRLRERQDALAGAAGDVRRRSARSGPAWRTRRCGSGRRRCTKAASARRWWRIGRRGFPRAVGDA